MKTLGFRLRFIVFPVLIVLLGLLTFSDGFQHHHTLQARANEYPGFATSVYYTEPMDKLGSMKITSTIKTDILTNNIHVSSVEIWKGIQPRYIIAIRYSDSNIDKTERRFIFVVRNSTGAPWIIVDAPVTDPTDQTGVTAQINRTIWLALDVDKTILQSNPKYPASWLAKGATSTFEIGIIAQKRFVVYGVGEVPVESQPYLTPLYQIANLIIFDS